MAQVFSAGCRCWKSGLKPVWGVTTSISNVISGMELGHPDLLPNMRPGSTLLLASDYGGQHKRATHETFSFLLADHIFCWLWDDMRQQIRRSLLTDRRRMSFKALNDKQRRSALLPFLGAANWIPGLIATVLVEKRFAARMGLNARDRCELPAPLRSWPASTVRKLVWVSHLGALMIAGLSAPHQNVIWVTDQDDIVANAERVIDVTPMMAGMVSRYSEQSMGHFRFGAASCDSGDLFLEDLLAIPDLVSGAFAEIPGAWGPQGLSQVHLPLRDRVSAKALEILAWFGTRTFQPLRRLALSVECGDCEDKARVRALELWPADPLMRT